MHVGGSAQQPPKPVRQTSRPEDSLSSHVAAATARANHIVEEFESMLLVTGGLSIKQVAKIRSEAGLASMDAGADAHNHRQALKSSTERSHQAARSSDTHARTNDAACSTEDCASGASSSNSGLSAAGTRHSASRPAGKLSSKASLKALKENRAPSLPYVTGGQVRGARRPHDSGSRLPLKPSSKGSDAAPVDMTAMRTIPSSSRASKVRRQ